MADVSSAVDAIFDAATTQHSVFYDLYDAEMRSPCQVGEPFVHDQFDVVAWRPQRREQASDFSGLENALETEIHKDVKAYYGRYWSGCIETEHEEGHVSLIFLWNQKDIRSANRKSHRSFTGAEAQPITLEHLLCVHGTRLRVVSRGE